jgi:hypothetical protein
VVVNDSTGDEIDIYSGDGSGSFTSQGTLYSSATNVERIEIATVERTENRSRLDIISIGDDAADLFTQIDDFSYTSAAEIGYSSGSGGGGLTLTGAAIGFSQDATASGDYLDIVYYNSGGGTIDTLVGAAGNPATDYHTVSSTPIDGFLENVDGSAGLDLISYGDEGLFVFESDGSDSFTIGDQYMGRSIAAAMYDSTTSSIYALDKDTGEFLTFSYNGTSLSLTAVGDTGLGAPTTGARIIAGVYGTGDTEIAILYQGSSSAFVADPLDLESGTTYSTSEGDTLDITSAENVVINGYNGFLVGSEGGAAQLFLSSDGGGLFPSTITSITSNQFATGDIDGDGNVDVIQMSGTNIEILSGDGTGSFASEGTIDVSGAGTISQVFLKSTDSNDAGLDIVVIGSSGTITAQTNDPENFSYDPIYTDASITSSNTKYLAGDLGSSPDGTIDLVSLNTVTAGSDYTTYSGTTSTQFIGDGGRTLNTTENTINFTNNVDLSAGYFAADLEGDADGLYDLVFKDVNGDGVVYSIDGTGPFSATERNIGTVGDFIAEYNGEESVRTGIVSADTDGTFDILTGDGSYNFSTATSGALGDTISGIFTSTAELDGDAFLLGGLSTTSGIVSSTEETGGGFNSAATSLTGTVYTDATFRSPTGYLFGVVSGADSIQTASESLSDNGEGTLEQRESIGAYSVQGSGVGTVQLGVGVDGTTSSSYDTLNFASSADIDRAGFNYYDVNNTSINFEVAQSAGEYFVVTTTADLNNDGDSTNQKAYLAQANSVSGLLEIKATLATAGAGETLESFAIETTDDGSVSTYFVRTDGSSYDDLEQVTTNTTTYATSSSTITSESVDTIVDVQTSANGNYSAILYDDGAVTVFDSASGSSGFSSGTAGQIAFAGSNLLYTTTTTVSDDTVRVATFTGSAGSFTTDTDTEVTVLSSSVLDLTGTDSAGADPALAVVRTSGSSQLIEAYEATGTGQGDLFREITLDSGASIGRLTADNSSGFQISFYGNDGTTGLGVYTATGTQTSGSSSSTTTQILRRSFEGAEKIADLSINSFQDLKAVRAVLTEIAATTENGVSILEDVQGSISEALLAVQDLGDLIQSKQSLSSSDLERLLRKVEQEGEYYNGSGKGLSGVLGAALRAYKDNS